MVIKLNEDIMRFKSFLNIKRNIQIITFKYFITMFHMIKILHFKIFWTILNYALSDQVYYRLEPSNSVNKHMFEEPY